MSTHYHNNPLCQPWDSLIVIENYTFLTPAADQLLQQGFQPYQCARSSAPLGTFHCPSLSAQSVNLMYTATTQRKQKVRL